MERMQGYVVMMHLVSQGWMRFTDITKLIFFDNFHLGTAIQILSYIHTTIGEIEKDWNEIIPRINIFVFKANGDCSDWVCEHVFESEENGQPTPQQIAKLSADIANYDKWDKVIEVFRNKAFETKES